MHVFENQQNRTNVVFGLILSLSGLMLRKITITPVLIFLFIAVAHAQQPFIDSLENKLKTADLSQYEKTMLRCKLARACFETDINKALDLATVLPGPVNPDANAWVYATRIHLLIQKKDRPAAYAALDSALLYEASAKDPLAKGMAWFRAGWLDLVDNENDLAVTRLLKAVDLFKEADNNAYAALACHYLASIYSYGADEQRQGAYAVQCLQLAATAADPDVLNTAFYTMGQYMYDKYKLHNKNKLILDTALQYYHNAIALNNSEKGRILVRSNTAGIALNTANIYFQHFPVSYRDSVFYYLDMAQQIATETRLTEILVNCYAMRSEYVLQNGNPEEAAQLLQAALTQVNISGMKMPLSQSRIYRALARVAEQRNDNAAALSYLKSYIAANEEAVSQERMASAQRIEARYRAARQEQKIQLLEQEAGFLHRRNMLYVGLGISILAALILLLVSFNYRLKASIRKNELANKEREESALKIKLREAEASQLMAEQTLLRERQERLEKELLAQQLHKEEKSQLMQLLTDHNMAGNDQLKRLVKRQQQLDEEYEDHTSDFVEVSPAFFERLGRQANDTLTRLDMKYCSYILMGLSNKEISERLNIEHKSIRMARYRIKQKLGLGKDDSLDQFIRTLS